MTNETETVDPDVQAEAQKELQALNRRYGIDADNSPYETIYDDAALEAYLGVKATAEGQDDTPEPAPSHDSVWSDVLDLPPGERQAFLESHLAAKEVFEKSGGVVVPGGSSLARRPPIPSRDDEGYARAANEANRDVARVQELIASGDIVASPTPPP